MFEAMLDWRRESQSPTSTAPLPGETELVPDEGEHRTKRLRHP